MPDWQPDGRVIIPELGGTVQDPASGSMHVGGPVCWLVTQREEGGPGLLAVEALVPGMFPPWLIRVRFVTAVIRR